MFGRGSIDIRLQRTGYQPGDTISGTVVLALKKPMKAREVVISLIGEQRNTRIGGTPGNKDVSTTTQRVRVYDFKQQLDSEKEYSQGQEFQFEMKIPADILSAAPQMPDPGGKLGQALMVAQSAAAMSGRIPLQRVKWYLQAKLDIPGGLDISKKADITIG